jgi:hypothetical protein
MIYCKGLTIINLVSIWEVKLHGLVADILVEPGSVGLSAQQHDGWFMLVRSSRHGN